MYKRLIPLKEWLQRHSLFLLGPRQTGKTTLLEELFPKARTYNLLEADTFRILSANPEMIRQTLTNDVSVIVIDEIQKLPILLDEVHLLIQRNKNLRFVLTGSSARKLKRGSANLLAGRAWICHLHPLVSGEIGAEQMIKKMNVGGLPSIFDSSDSQYDLQAYVGTYLQEEIKAEGLTRKIENFSRFLNVAVTCNAEQLDFTSVANDAQVPPRTVREYFQILEDTLLGYIVPAFQKTTKRKPVATAKFYFFDLGVSNFLARREKIEPGTELFGKSLEQLIFLEMKAYLDYHRIDLPISYWRSLSQIEVDFLVGERIGIEVKARPRIAESDAKGLRALSEELKLKRKIIVATESQRRKLADGVEIIPYQTFLAELWQGKIF